MKIVVENIEGIFYVDIVLDPKEIKALADRQMVENSVDIGKRKWYFGVRQRGFWDEGFWDEEEK